MVSMKRASSEIAGGAAGKGGLKLAKEEGATRIKAELAKTTIAGQGEGEAKEVAGDAAAGGREEKVAPTSAMVVRTVVRESHNENIRKVMFNRCGSESEVSNLFATVGSNQATVYDGSHFGEYACLVVHYTHESNLTTSTWIDASEQTKHPKGDCHLAFGDASGQIGIISVAVAAVTHQLEGHKKEVIDLATSAARPGYLLSLSKDDTVKLWSVYEESCVATFEVGSGVCSIAWNPDGKSFLAGSKSGKLHCWSLDSDSDSDSDQKKTVKLEELSHREALDCIKFVGENRVLTKSVDGRIFLSELGFSHTHTHTHTLKVLREWKVQGGYRCISNVDVTRDGRYFVCGNAEGAVHVFETEKGGEVVAKLEPYKVSRPVEACAISDNYKDVLSTLGESFLFRYRHFTPKQKKTTNEEKEEKDKDSQ